MPVSNEHLNKKNIQVWDGISFMIVSKTEANKLVKAGTHQISTNLASKDLKHQRDFKAAKADTSLPTKADTSLPGVPTSAKKKKTYKTRQLKADA